MNELEARLQSATDMMIGMANQITAQIKEINDLGRALAERKITIRDREKEIGELYREIAKLQSQLRAKAKQEAATKPISIPKPVAKPIKRKPIAKKPARFVQREMEVWML